MKRNFPAAIALTAGVVAAAAVHAENDDIELTRTVCLSLGVSTTVKPQNPDMLSDHDIVFAVPELSVKIAEIHSGLAAWPEWSSSGFDTVSPMIAGLPASIDDNSRHCFVIQVQIRPFTTRIEIVEEPEPGGEAQKHL